MGVRTSTSCAHVCCGQHSDTTLALRRGIEVLLPSAGAGCRLFDCTSASLALGQDPGIVSKSSKVRENRLLGGLQPGEGFPLAALPCLHGTEYGKEFVQLHLRDVHIVEERAREGCCLVR